MKCLGGIVLVGLLLLALVVVVGTACAWRRQWNRIPYRPASRFESPKRVL